MTEDMLEPFEDDPPPPKPAPLRPRIAHRRHRNGTFTRVLVRAEAGNGGRVHGVGVKFSPDEWALIQRTVLAELGLSKIDE